MAHLLAALPAELFEEILRLLLLPDQAALGRTCKLINQLLTPTIWSDIELHHRGTHEGVNVRHEVDVLPWNWDGYKELLERVRAADDPVYPYKKSVLDPSSRKYAQVEFDPGQWAKRFDSWHQQCGDSSAAPYSDANYTQFGRGKKLLRVMKITSKARWDFLSQFVKSLCISAKADYETVEIIASFHNLRSLELIGLALGNSRVATALPVHLPRLHSLKLRGFFPAALVQKFCDSAEQITHLNLGLLGPFMDDSACAETVLEVDENWTPTGDKADENSQPSGGAAATLASRPVDTINGELVRDGNDSNADKYENDESGGHKMGHDGQDLPWAFHGPIWLPKSFHRRFTRLTHLHLIKPYTSVTQSSWVAHRDFFYHIPQRYEQGLNNDWVFMIQAVAGTLKELILEHRIPIALEYDLSSRALPSHKRSSNVFHGTDWANSEPDRGDELFGRSVLRLLLQESASFLKLRQLSLRGIQVHGLPTWDADEVPDTNEAPDNVELLRQGFPTCNIEIFEQVYPLHVYSCRDDSVPEGLEKVRQDEGNGLLYDGSYYKDYMWRFGPQWRIQD